MQITLNDAQTARVSAIAKETGHAPQQVIDDCLTDAFNEYDITSALNNAETLDAQLQALLAKWSPLIRDYCYVNQVKLPSNYVNTLELLCKGEMRTMTARDNIAVLCTIFGAYADKTPLESAIYRLFQLLHRIHGTETARKADACNRAKARELVAKNKQRKAAKAPAT